MQNKTDHLSIYKHRKGFTLIEVVVTITVIAILATIAVVSYRAVQKKAGDVATAANLTVYSDALELYYLKNKSYPVGPSCLGSKPSNREGCGGFYYEGAGCSAFGIESGHREAEITWNPKFDSGIDPYISQPKKVQARSYKNLFQSVDGCSVYSEADMPTYRTYSRVTIKTDGTYSLRWSTAGCDTNINDWINECTGMRQAYVVTYAINKDGSCTSGRGSRDSDENDLYVFSEGKVCTMLGGNIEHE